MKVLISAYICAPNRGSEPGAGWNWSLAAAQDNDVWVITRESNRPAIEAELAAHPHPRLHFVYVELPPWGLRLKKGERGIRYFSYYTLWQLAALRTARKLHEEVRFRSRPPRHVRKHVAARSGGIRRSSVRVRAGRRRTTRPTPPLPGARCLREQLARQPGLDCRLRVASIP